MVYYYFCWCVRAGVRVSVPAGMCSCIYSRWLELAGLFPSSGCQFQVSGNMVCKFWKLTRVLLKKIVLHGYCANVAKLSGIHPVCNTNAKLSLTGFSLQPVNQEETKSAAANTLLVTFSKGYLWRSRLNQKFHWPMTWLFWSHTLVPVRAFIFVISICWHFTQLIRFWLTCTDCQHPFTSPLSYHCY